MDLNDGELSHRDRIVSDGSCTAQAAALLHGLVGGINACVITRPWP